MKTVLSRYRNLVRLTRPTEGSGIQRSKIKCLTVCANTLSATGCRLSIIIYCDSVVAGLGLIFSGHSTGRQTISVHLRKAKQNTVFSRYVVISLCDVKSVIRHVEDLPHSLDARSSMLLSYLASDKIHALGTSYKTPGNCAIVHSIRSHNRY